MRIDIPLCTHLFAYSAYSNAIRAEAPSFLSCSAPTAAVVSLLMWICVADLLHNNILQPVLSVVGRAVASWTVFDFKSILSACCHCISVAFFGKKKKIIAEFSIKHEKSLEQRYPLSLKIKFPRIFFFFLNSATADFFDLNVPFDCPPIFYFCKGFKGLISTKREVDCWKSVCRNRGAPDPVHPQSDTR